MISLPEKQKSIFSYIKTYIEKNGQAPTLGEIANEFGVKVPTVREQLAALEKKHLIQRKANSHRGIALLGEDEGTADVKARVVSDEPKIEIRFGRTGAGNPIDQTQEEYETISVPRRLISNPNKNYFALKVVGRSMIDAGIFDGEIVVAEQASIAHNGDLVIYEDGEHNVTLKYYYREANRVRLEPRNKQDNYQPIYLSEGQVLGIFKGILEEEGTLNVN